MLLVLFVNVIMIFSILSTWYGNRTITAFFIVRSWVFGRFSATFSLEFSFTGDFFFFLGDFCLFGLFVSVRKHMQWRSRYCCTWRKTTEKCQLLPKHSHHGMKGKGETPEQDCTWFPPPLCPGGTCAAKGAHTPAPGKGFKTFLEGEMSVPADARMAWFL